MRLSRSWFAKMSSQPDWIDVPPLEFTLRGMHGASVHFVAEAVLARRVARTGVIAFAATLTVPTAASTFQSSFHFADYNGLRPLRDGLLALRNGTGESVSLQVEGFSLTVGLHATGVRRGLLVQGYCSSLHDPEIAPWPAGPAIGDIVLRESHPAACTRFAFPSSLVDPPYVDLAIEEINAILCYLEQEGYEP